jgi:hypothetical protein
MSAVMTAIHFAPHASALVRTSLYGEHSLRLYLDGFLECHEFFLIEDIRPNMSIFVEGRSGKHRRPVLRVVFLDRRLKFLNFESPAQLHASVLILRSDFESDFQLRYSPELLARLMSSNLFHYRSRQFNANWLLARR